MHSFQRLKIPSLFLVIIFLCHSCNNKKTPASKNINQPVIVDVIIAENKSISNVIEANGTIIANESVELHPEVSGRITYLNIPEGSYISKGTLIAKINDEDLQMQVKKSTVQLELAQLTEERLRKLLAISGVNQADYDAALNQVNSLKADIAYTQALVDKTVINAPFSGVAGLRQVSPGAYVTPSTVIATMQQIDQLKVDFTLPEEYAQFVSRGNIVTMQIDASDSVKHRGRVIAIEPRANTLTRNLLVRVLLEDNAKANPGAFVKVYVNANVDKKAIMAPTNSIIPDDKNKQLVLVKNGKAQFVNVTTGIRQQSLVEIVKGINPGDTVVVTGVLFTRPDNPVKVRTVKKLDEL